jgi:hypothetical protein
MPYPGNAWQHPKIHQSPDCLHLGGWHDVAGALTLPEKGEHHVFQGCPASQGWSHSFSTVRAWPSAFFVTTQLSWLT